MLDNLLSSSFELDYEMFSTIDYKYKKILSKINSPTIESNNIFAEYEKYVKYTSECFNEMESILKRCDEQRKNFRIITMKQSKDRMLIDKLLKEEDCSLILSKLLIQEELKNQVLDKNLAKLKEKDAMISDLKSQLEFYTSTFTCSSNFHPHSSNTSSSNHGYYLNVKSQTKSTKTNTMDSLNVSLISEATMNNNASKKKSPVKRSGQEMKKQQQVLNLLSLNEAGLNDNPELKLDFKSGNFKISNSPLQSPTAKTNIMHSAYTKTPSFRKEESSDNKCSAKIGNNNRLRVYERTAQPSSTPSHKTSQPKWYSKSIEYENSIDYLNYQTLDNNLDLVYSLADYPEIKDEPEYLKTEGDVTQSLSKTKRSSNISNEVVKEKNETKSCSKQNGEHAGVGRATKINTNNNNMTQKKEKERGGLKSIIGINKDSTIPIPVGTNNIITTLMTNNNSLSSSGIKPTSQKSRLSTLKKK